MYNKPVMRRVNVHIDEDLDVALATEAARRGQSKAALLREAARNLLDAVAIDDDPWATFTGSVNADPDDQRHHDDVIYG